MRLAAVPIAALLILASACSDESGVEGFNEFAAHVEKSRVGSDADQWIEMKNIAAEWERTGLIFGYVDDYNECLKAIDGLKRANPSREYRCVPAN